MGSGPSRHVFLRRLLVFGWHPGIGGLAVSPKRVLNLLDSWRISVGVAFIFMALLTLWSMKLTLDQRSLEEARASEIRAAAVSQVNDCYDRNSEAPVLRKLLTSIRAVLDDNEAKMTLDNYIQRLRETTPTTADCNTLANRLGLPAR